MEKQTFQIPIGCKTVSIEQIGDTIVTTFEKEQVFKKGDFLVFDETNLCFIFNNIIENKTNYFYGFYLDTKRVKDGCFERWVLSNKTLRLATDEEKQLLLDKMHENGYDWDAEKMEVVKYRWKPKEGDVYYFPQVLSQDLYSSYTWHDDIFDKSKFKNGVVRKTKEEAIECAPKMLEAVK